VVTFIAWSQLEGKGVCAWGAEMGVGKSKESKQSCQEKGDGSIILI